MAKVYDPPEELPWTDPDYKNYDYRKEQQREDDYVKKLAEWCRKRHSGDTIGKIIRWQVADGYAQYMVECEKPLRLIHLRFGDGYSAGAIWERGLRLTDVRQMIKRDEGLRSIFAKKDGDEDV